MIRLKITNKNGDILYERKDSYYVRFGEEDFEDIKNILSEIGSDTVYVDIDCDIHDNPFMVYSYHSAMRGGKTVIQNKIKNVLDEYERQLAALPAEHPADNDDSPAREVGGHDRNDKKNGHDRNDSHDKKNGHDNYDEHIPTLSDMDIPDHEALRKDIGSYVGCGRHESCRREDGRDKNDKKGNKKCNLEDFITYLNTYDSWAALLNDLQFYSEKQDEEQTAKLIKGYREWRDRQIFK